MNWFGKYWYIHVRLAPAPGRDAFFVLFAILGWIFVSFIPDFLPIPYGNAVKDKITICNYSFITRERNTLAHELTCWVD